MQENGRTFWQRAPPATTSSVRTGIVVQVDVLLAERHATVDTVVRPCRERLPFRVSPADRDVIERCRRRQKHINASDASTLADGRATAAPAVVAGLQLAGLGYRFRSR